MEKNQQTKALLKCIMTAIKTQTGRNSNNNMIKCQEINNI